MIFCEGLVVPSVTLPKLKLVVLTIRPVVPVPDKLISVGELVALLTTLTPFGELTKPADPGLKAT